MWVVGQLTVDGIYGQQWFMAYVDGEHEVDGCQAAQCAQQTVPSFIPFFDQLIFGEMLSLRAELRLPVPSRLFSVFCQEIGPPADHIAAEVVDDDGDAVGFLA